MGPSGPVYGGAFGGVDPSRLQIKEGVGPRVSLSQEFSGMLVLPPIDLEPASSSSAPGRGKLAGLKLFNQVGAQAISKLEESAWPIAFEPGAEVDTPIGSVFIISEGEVSIFLHDAAEKKFLLGTAKAGDVVGEMSHLAQEGPNDQKVLLQALTAVKGLKLPSALFFEVVSSDPSASMNLMKLLAGRLGAMNRFAKQAVDIEIDPTKMEGRTFGERLADLISAKVGSWRFIAGGVAFTSVWMGANALGIARGWDPYPFIFLNLIFSVVSAATMPVLLMSQNRQTQLDRMAARANHIMTLRATQLIARLFRENRRLQRSVQDIEEHLRGSGSRSAQDQEKER